MHMHLLMFTQLYYKDEQSPLCMLFLVTQSSGRVLPLYKCWQKLYKKKKKEFDKTNRL